MASKQIPRPLSAGSLPDRRNNHTHTHPYLNQASSFYFPSNPTSRATTPSPFSRSQSLELYPQTPIALPVSDGDNSISSSAIQTWTPLALWVLTSIGFLLAITVWRTELFKALDDFSQYLKYDIYFGYSVIFTCIFITTFPPFPLYSTLIVLSGYTFGAWTGFVVSYLAALSGAVVVYLLSLHFCHGMLSDMLNRAAWMRRVVSAIEKQPTLLFLIRLAPYPYNLLNAILAAAPSLTFQTYFCCTALSLFKLIIHTWAGSAIHSFAEGTKGDGENEVVRYWTYFGLLLSIGLFGYLSYLAKKTVEKQAETEMREVGNQV